MSAGTVDKTIIGSFTIYKVVKLNTDKYFDFIGQTFFAWYDNYVSTKMRGSLNKFPDFFRMGTFTDSTHMKF